MNYEERDGQVEAGRVEDLEIEAALRHFRESVHGWSEQEYSKPRVIKRSRWSGLWRVMANPAMVSTLATALVVTSIGIPVTVRHERQVAAQQAALDLQKKLADEKAAQAAAEAEDEDLLSHLDSDIAQAAPDAMQPLVSMMSDTSSKE
jgi:hypothetical protein